jgi:SPP1 gp7 family putative phage head morphogenesis protein
MSSPLLDLAVRRQMLLERLKAGQSRDFTKGFDGLEKALLRAFGGVDGELNAKGKRYLAKFLKEAEDAVTAPLAKSTELYMAELEKTAGVYAAAESIDILKSVRGLDTLKVPNAKQAFKRALENPMSHSGETLTEFVESFGQREAKRVLSRIRLGSSQGLTNQEIIKSIIGTKARNYKDGVLAISRRNADTMVRTATQHVASTGRQALWEANADVVEKYQWVSTLDRSTTAVCKSLDGREFELGKGPTPPIHIRCRSTTIAVLNPKFDFLKEGRTRSAEFGPVAGDETYYDWLKRQPEGVQVEALGPTRAKLFKEGGLTPDEFATLQLDRNFKPLTLDEMKALEPEAFKRAGLGGG